MNLNTGTIIGFYIIFGIGCGIAFGNTMTEGNLRLPVQQKAYGNTCFNTLKIMKRKKNSKNKRHKFY